MSSFITPWLPCIHRWVTRLDSSSRYRRALNLATAEESCCRATHHRMQRSGLSRERRDPRLSAMGLRRLVHNTLLKATTFALKKDILRRKQIQRVWIHNSDVLDRRRGCSKIGDWTAFLRSGWLLCRLALRSDRIRLHAFWGHIVINGSVGVTLMTITKWYLICWSRLTEFIYASLELKFLSAMNLGVRKNFSVASSYNFN
jgi:hypothetical protein